MAEERVPMLEIPEFLMECGGETLCKCMQCGTCTAVCPWGLTSTLAVRRMMQLAGLGLEGYEDSDLWKCVQCHTCVKRCPRGVELAKCIRAARSMMAEGGAYPKTVAGALASLKSEGNPWQNPAANRKAWTEGLDVPVFDKEKHEVLLYICCSGAYDPRAVKVSKALVALLRKAGVAFGTLETETCCGDVALRVGAADGYERASSTLAEALEEAGNPDVVTLSPHCFDVLKNHFDPPCRAVHYTEYLQDLLKSGRLPIEGAFEGKVTFHDPCYLGRINDVFEAPRVILRAAGVDLVEMACNRSLAVCCGGGGGGVFAEVDSKDRLGAVRANQAIETGAGVLAVACPYCLTMLEDGVLASGNEGAIEVLDVAEILARAAFPA